MPRHRRGNYTILFVLTASVMLSYLAFSVDGGRIMIAHLDAENAAEAASLAAMYTITHGGSVSEAEAAGAMAANNVRMADVGKYADAEPDFAVQYDWGQWRWDQGMTSRDSRWQDGFEDTPQALKVAVDTRGISTVFGPAIGIVSGTEADQSRFGRVGIVSGSMAAVRNRDFVVVVDVSHFSDAILGEVREGLSSFITQLEATGVPGDSVALVAYAGDGYTYDLSSPGMYMGGHYDMAYVAPPEPPQPFVSVATSGGANAARSTMDLLEVCSEDERAWVNYYRFSDDADVDPELAAGFGGYRLIGYPLLTGIPQFMVPYPVNGTEGIAAFIETASNNYGLPELYTSGNWGMNPTSGQQCYAWTYGQLFYMQFDPRSQASASSGNRSPLACHFGNPLKDTMSRYDVARSIPALNEPCGIELDGYPRYGSPWGGPVVFRDRGFSQAGSNPASGLARANEMLMNRTTTGEATVVLISSTYPRCGPVITPDLITNCDGQYLSETAAVLDTMDQNKINTHVMAIAPAGSQTDIQLSGMTTGRGLYQRLSSPESLPSAFADVLSDVRLQIVR